MNLRGCGTALVTPFRQDGALDETALRDLVTWQIESGIDFLVPCGTTGETPTLSRREWLRVLELTIETAAGRVPIVAGASSNCTRDAIEKARTAAERKGVDAILTASPYYNKPTQDGQYQHFRAIAQAVRKPIIVYNVPGRTGANIEPATLSNLAKIRNIVGVKEASGNISQIVQVFNAVPASFLVFSGDDSITLPIIALGGAGVISVASNEIPHEMTEMTSAALNNDWESARHIHRRYLPLMEANFIESNPVPVKAVLAMMGKLRETYRLPLVRMKDENRAKLQKIAAEAGLPTKAAAQEPAPRQVAPESEPAARTAAPEGALPVAAESEPRGESTVPAAPAANHEDVLDLESEGEAPLDVAPAAEARAAEAAESAVQVEAPPAAHPTTPTKTVAPAEPITFYLFENWQAGPHKTVLHRSNCGIYRNGRGGSEKTEPAADSRSRWHGPFSTIDEARGASRGMTGVLIRSECKCISSR
ncbi:MAG TPA: 4-hydroxy-tetrahydrodipicolinate synthase [Terriglobales bacterium]|nr:4-hydroxy-tetrahydrodipicolinate synthase [Terriglobales bacterium]